MKDCQDCLCPNFILIEKIRAIFHNGKKEVTITYFVLFTFPGFSIYSSVTLIYYVF